MTFSESLHPDIFQVLENTLEHTPYEEITRITYNTFVPGRFKKVHTGRWNDEDVELKQLVGDISTIEREINILRDLGQCPQILHLYGFTVEPTNSIPYLILQHNEHGSMNSYLTNFHSHLTWADRYNLAMDIALGVRYIHAKGYKHRHLHSSSILIDVNGSAVLSDFGNPKESEVLSSREHTTRMAYLAPERLTKNPPRYTFECDIYSLGVVLWEISSGRPPFEDILTPENIQNGAIASLAQNIVAGRRERAVPNTDPIYEDLFTRCWSPIPQDRPTIETVVQTLGALLKQPSSSITRQFEELSIINESEARTPKEKMTIKVGYQSAEVERGILSPQTRSRELLLSPREPNYAPAPIPPPPSIPPPIPPSSQRRKHSVATSFAPTARSMSISSNSSSGSSSVGIPAVPSRDNRRISTISPPHSAEILQSNSPRKRAPLTIWEACKEGSADLVEWNILTTGVSPDAYVYLPLYSKLAEVAPIHIACFYQPESLLDVLKTLQRIGANMELRTTLTNQTALHFVLEHATNYNLALEAVKYLMSEIKLGVNDPDNRGITPFHKYIKNPNLSAIPSVASSELYSLLREKGAASLSLESLNEGNALGMTARYLRVDLMKLFLLTDLSSSEHKSLSYAMNAVEAPLSESRSSKVMQDLCRNVLSEWKGERGETKRVAMAERILEHQSATQGPGSLPLSAPISAPSSSKSKKQGGGGILGLGKSKSVKEESSPAAPAVTTVTEVDVAKKILQSTAVKQRKLKTLIATSGF
ncbi:hypothetical protein BGZ76_003963 [Entomortierella beljakovae]|nr:hypothetical protein BGZ76_003963 [Entomortierella beljakovae]